MKKSDRHQAEPDLFANADQVQHFTATLKFSGTDNPRFLRVIQALLVRPMPREHVDRMAGCSNGPALISELRNLGLGKNGLICTMVPDHDRDGCPVRRGVYALTTSGRRAINVWLSKRKGGAK